MDFLLSDELREFSASLRKYFAGAFPSSALRKALLTEDGLPRNGLESEHGRVWQGISELGALAAPIPEAYGGLGFGPLAGTLVVEEAAHVLSPLPVFESIALGAAPLALLGSDEAREKFLPQIASGELRFTGGFQQLCAPVAGEQAVSAERFGEEYRLNGSLHFVPAFEHVQAVLLPATLPGTTEQGLFLLKLSAGRTPAAEYLPTFDLVRSYAHLTLDNIHATLVSRPGLSGHDWQRLRNEIFVYTVADMIGAAQSGLAMSVEYAKTRQQFGQPIGRFQAISHKLAEMFTNLESIASLCRFAAHAGERDPAQLALSAPALKALASDELPRLLQSAVQVHGGIGFTYEYDLHLYLRRVQVQARLFGAAEELFEETAARAMTELA